MATCKDNLQVREKLVEQLSWWATECDRTNYGCQASKLLVAAAKYIANGVTVQEWISVEDRLPDKELSEQKASANGHKVFPCLIVYEFDGLKSVRTAWYERSIDGEAYRFLDENSIDATKRTLYWMQRPTPPKGE